MCPSRCIVAIVLLAGHAHAQVVSYDGTSFPEEAGLGWTRLNVGFLADRSIEDGWVVQLAEIVPGPPIDGEQDFYRRELDDQADLPTWFLEWVVVSDGPEAFGAVAPATIAAGGITGILYHFVIARDKMRFLRDPLLPILIVDIEPDVPHTYRLELAGAESYRFSIDDVEVDSGVPEGPYPTADSSITFGHRAAIEASTTRWDRIEFGMTPPPIPTTSTWGIVVMTLCVMIVGTLFIRRHADPMST